MHEALQDQSHSIYTTSKEELFTTDKQPRLAI